MQDFHIHAIFQLKCTAASGTRRQGDRVSRKVHSRVQGDGLCRAVKLLTLAPVGWVEVETVQTGSEASVCFLGPVRMRDCVSF